MSLVAGFSGVATALTMAERSYSVVLLESNRIGWGSSGRNGGQVIAGISGEAEIKRQLGNAGAKLTRDIRYRGNEIIEERVAKYGIECDLKHGWMEAAARPRHMDALRAHVEHFAGRGPRRSSGNRRAERYDPSARYPRSTTAGRIDWAKAATCTH